MTEVSATNAPGLYVCDLTQGETNANDILFSAKSATANISVIGAPARVFTRPTSFGIAPGNNGALLVAGSNTDTTFGVFAITGTFDVTGATTFLGAFSAANASNDVRVDTRKVSGTAQTAGDLAALINTLDNFVDTEVADIQARLPAALTAGGNMKSDALALSGDTTAADNAEAFFDGTGYAGTNNVIPTVTTLTNLPAITAGWLTATGIAADAITAAKVAADVGTEIGTAVWATATRVLTASTNLGDLDDAVLAILGTPAGASMSADIAAIEAQTDDIGAAGAGLTAINLPDQTMNITGDITGNLSGSVGSVTGTVGSVTGAVGSVTGAVGSVTGAVGSVTLAITLPTIPTAWITADGIAANAIGASELAADAATEIATAVLTTAMTESYAANGAAPTLAQAQFAMHQMLMDFGISGTSLTVLKLDNATTAFVVTLSDATNPVAAART